MDEPTGRHSECEILGAFLDELGVGHGAVRLLEGDGGTGKTTLADWTSRQAANRGFRVLTGRSWELSQTVQYEPIVAAIGRFLRSVPTDERTELVRGLGSLGALIDGLDLPPQPDPSATGSRARLHDAIATVVARAAERRPLLFVVDDLHWIDASSLEVVQYLCRDLPYVNLGILATLRPDDADARTDVRSFLAPIRRAAFTRSVTVRNLDREQTTALIRDRLPGDVPDRLVDLVWARSIGTPLFVHELIEDLIDRRLLTNDEAGWTLHDPDPPVPRAAADLIRDRIERAASEERELLDILAIADEPMPITVVARVSSLEPDEIAQRLERLRTHRLVACEADEYGVVHWRVEHPIISQVIAAGLNEQVRQRLHRRLAGADPDAPLARQARHILRAGPPRDPVQAAEVLVAAGQEALRQAAPAPAIEHFQASLRMLDVDGDDPALGPGVSHRTHAGQDDAAATIVDLCCDAAVGLGVALLRSQRRGEATWWLERAYALAERSGSIDRMLDVLVELDRALFLSGRSVDPIRQRLDAVQARLEADQDWSRLATVMHQRFLVQLRAGEDTGTERVNRILEVLRGRPLDDRGRQFVWLVERYPLMMCDPMVDADFAVDELLTWCDQGNVHWEHKYRAHLLALDLAGHLGLPDPLEDVVARTRRLEREVGAVANWRIPVMRGIERVAAGGETEYLEPLEDVRPVRRSLSFIGLIRGLHRRYRAGPTEATDLFDGICAEIEGDSDRVAVVLRDLGRLLLVEGTDAELDVACTAAASVLRYGVRSGVIVFTETGLHAYATALAFLLAGQTGQLETLLRRLRESSRGRGLPGAAIELIEARRSSIPEDRAHHLLAAADRLDACRYHLAAAERRIEAAEAAGGAVDDQTFDRSVAAAEAAGADWLVGRAAQLGRAPRVSPPTGHAVDELLTAREWEVACEVARGLTNREVGAELFISIRTVTSHLDHIYTKLGFSSREQLTEYVHDRGGPTGNT